MSFSSSAPTRWRRTERREPPAIAGDLSKAGTVFQIGLPPSPIDILSSISGVTFEDAWPRRVDVMIEALTIPVLGREDFIKNKKATGRPKDLSDLTLLPPA